MDIRAKNAPKELSIYLVKCSKTGVIDGASTQTQNWEGVYVVLKTFLLRLIS